jgi:hypothetical protein
MPADGFSLNPCEIAEHIGKALTKSGWELSTFFDTYAHADYDTGMMLVHDPVDSAVVVFVGSREQAAVVANAAREALPSKLESERS